MRDRNIDEAVVEDFGREWQTFDQSALSAAERKAQFDAYFEVFSWGGGGEIAQLHGRVLMPVVVPADGHCSLQRG